MILKGGKRKLNQAPYLVKGYRLFDKVSYDNQEYYVFGRRKTCYFDIRRLDGTKANNGSVSYKKLGLKEKAQSYLIERRMCISPLPTQSLEVGYPAHN